MRIFTSIIAFLAGAALTAYGYLARVIASAADADVNGIINGDIPILGFVLRLMFEGDIPQFSGMLYVGVFVMVIAVVYGVGLFSSMEPKHDD